MKQIIRFFKRRSRRTKIALVIFVVAFAGLGIYVIWPSGAVPQPQATAPLKSIAITGEAKVQITDNQFTPSTISVKRGTQVTWVNSGSKVHQVAADPYPRDNSIPGFDSTTLLNPQDSLSFVFNKAGTYSYHDEKNGLAMLGKIIVK